MTQPEYVLQNDMVTPDDLINQPGAPFEPDEVDRAVATVRKSVMWHIAPEISDTYSFDVKCNSTKIYLPTAYLVSIDAVRENGVAVASTDYEASKNLCILHRKTGYWPHGYGTVEVDMTHGYESVPLDLLTVIAAVAATSRRDQSVREAVAGTYTLPLVGIDNVIYRYVPWHRRFGWA